MHDIRTNQLNIMHEHESLTMNLNQIKYIQSTKRRKNIDVLIGRTMRSTIANKLEVQTNKI